MGESAAYRGGQVLFSTKGLPSQEGFGRWRDLFCSSAVPVRMEQDGPGDFSARCTVRNIGGLRLFSSSIRQGFVRRTLRTKGEIARTESDALVLTLSSVNRCGLMRQGRQDPIELHAGSWSLCNPEDHCETLTTPGRIETHLLAIPREIYLTMLPMPGEAFGRHMGAEHMTNRLVSNYIQTLSAGGGMPDAAGGDAIARNLMELIALAVRANGRDREDCANGLASGQLLGLMQYLDAHFRQPALSPLHAASHLGISPRHVHRLCERTGSSFSEQLYQRRLRAAHHLLTDPLHGHRSITDVAYDCGFHDLTHFGRRYREIYGVTPSEARGIRRC